MTVGLELLMKIPLFLATLTLLVVFAGASGQTPVHARTDDGKEVILLPDGTEVYVNGELGKTLDYTIE